MKAETNIDKINNIISNFNDCKHLLYLIKKSHWMTIELYMGVDSARKYITSNTINKFGIEDLIKSRISEKKDEYEAIMKEVNNIKLNYSKEESNPKNITYSYEAILKDKDALENELRQCKGELKRANNTIVYVIAVLLVVVAIGTLLFL